MFTLRIGCPHSNSAAGPGRCLVMDSVVDMAVFGLPVVDLLLIDL
jgi:hypothetical protein